MFGKDKNSYDDTSVMRQGGKEYGSDIHGVALRVNKHVWDMLKVLKKKKLFGFHFSARLGVKNTVVIMTHKDRDMLNLGQKALHEFQDIDGIIILSKVKKSHDFKNDLIVESSSDVPWKSKTGISTIIATLLIISGAVYYIMKQNQEKKIIPKEDNLTIAEKQVDIEKNIEINIQLMNALSRSFDNKENKKVKEVLAQVLEISTSTDILEKIPGYEKVELDNNKIISAYQDPNLKYVIKDSNGSMKELNEMAQAYAKDNNITEAKSILKELVKIGKESAKTNQESYEGVAKNLNTLGDISLQEGDKKSARNSLDEALEIGSGLAKKDMTRYGDTLAQTHNSMGKLHEEENQLKEAEKSYSKALEIHKKLAKQNPREYDMRIAKELANLGAINIFLNNKKRAERLYKEAEARYLRIVELYRSLVTKEPKIYKPHLAYSLNNLSNLYLHREQNLSRAIKPSEEALAIYKELDKIESKKYSEALVLTLYKVASIYNRQEKFNIAKSRYNEVISYCRGQNSSKYDEHIAKSLNALAWIGTKEPKFRDLKKAKEQLNEAIRLYTKLMKKSPKKFNEILSLSYSNLGYIATIEEKIKIASKMYKKALEIFDNFDNNLSYALFLSKQKRYKDANNIFKSIIKKYTQKEQQAYALMRYGEFYINIDKEEGYRKLKKALILYSELSKEFGSSYDDFIEKIEKILKSEDAKN
jgi:Tfp pilus assembly protein PilF